jgi:hypothetical protein
MNKYNLKLLIFIVKIFTTTSLLKIQMSLNEQILLNLLFLIKFCSFNYKKSIDLIVRFKLPINYNYFLFIICINFLIDMNSISKYCNKFTLYFIYPVNKFFTCFISFTKIFIDLMKPFWSAIIEYYITIFNFWGKEFI